jgi:integrase
MRPEECFRLRWDDLTWVNGRNGAVLVTRGKTASARRVIPMTPRVRVVLESRWEATGKPQEGWVWPAGTRSGHVEPSSLRKHHAKAFETMAEEAAKRNEKPTRPCCALLSTPHVSDAAGTIRLRRMDAGEDRWARLYRNLVALRTSFGGCGSGCNFSAGWAQNWAQRECARPVASCEKRHKRSTLS